MVASVILAVAITALEAVVAVWHWPVHAVVAERVVATTVVLERAAPTPRPTPRPTPVATPTPAPRVRVTTAPVQRAAPHTQRHAGGTSAAAPRTKHPVVHHTVTLPKAAGVTGVELAPGSGTGAGNGSGTGDAGSGAGNGTGGSGTGAVDADAPCGYVEFIPDALPKIVGSTAYETIRATVHYPDGHTASDNFPYPWVYADYMDTDPWSPPNERRGGDIAYAQLPPPGADAHRYPEIVRYILDHTNATGHTLLQPCPH